MVSRLTGQSLQRVEDPRFLTGQGRFLGAVNRPGQLYATFVRSPAAHAAINRIDVAAAREAPGVVAVFTGDEIAATMAMPMSVAGPPSLKSPPYWPLARDRVRAVGDPVALVVAETLAQAVDAAELVQLDLLPLAPVVTIAEAEADRSVLWPDIGTNVVCDEVVRYWRSVRRGRSRDRSPHYSHLRPAPLLSRPTRRSWRGGEYSHFAGEMHYWMANKRPHPMKMSFANFLGLPFTKIHTQSMDIGGAFGSKGQTTREDVALGAAIKLLARPIKWVETRTENLQAAGQGREEVLTVDAAVDADGRVRGLRVTHDHRRRGLSDAAVPGVDVPRHRASAAAQCHAGRGLRVSDSRGDDQ